MAQSTTPAAQILDNNLSLAQVLKAQEGWCTALLQISADYAKGERRPMEWCNSGGSAPA
jgi:hypothetical protein